LSRPSLLVRVPALLVAAFAVASGDRPASAVGQQRPWAGTYQLVRINRTRLPVYQEGPAPMAGISIKVGDLRLDADGSFTAHIRLVAVNRAVRTVDTVIAAGHWLGGADSIVISYRWRRGGAGAASDTITTVGRFRNGHLVIPRLAFFNERLFGYLRPLHFAAATAAGATQKAEP
jgi:hypothetical protein